MSQKEAAPMRSKWGIVVMIIALVASLTALMVISGCPAEQEEVIVPEEPMPEPPPVEEPAPAEGADAPAEGVEAPAEGAEVPAEGAEAPAEGADVPPPPPTD
jgi:hypothetical protein